MSLLIAFNILGTNFSPNRFLNIDITTTGEIDTLE